jgi:hypothetical protein
MMFSLKFLELDLGIIEHELKLAFLMFEYFKLRLIIFNGQILDEGICTKLLIYLANDYSLCCFWRTISSY